MHAELVIGQMASGYLDYAEIKNRAYQAEILEEDSQNLISKLVPYFTKVWPK